MDFQVYSQQIKTLIKYVYTCILAKTYKGLKYNDNRKYNLPHIKPTRSKYY